MIFSRLLPLIIIIGAIGLVWGYAHPTYTGSIAELQSDIKDFDTALDAAQQFKLKETELARQRAAIAPEDLARLEAFLPDTVDNVQLIVDLNALAERSGVELSEFNIGGEGASTPEGQGAATDPNATPVLENEATESIELSVDAVGTYESFRTFLDGVEQSLRPLDAVEVAVQDSQTGVYSYALTLRLYWLR